MEYQVSLVERQSEFSLALIQIQMNGHDWYAVENSLQWKALKEFVDRLETPDIRNNLHFSIKENLQMTNEEIKKILEKQLELLFERSKNTFDEEYLVEITHVMIETARFLAYDYNSAGIESFLPDAISKK